MEWLPQKGIHRGDINLNIRYLVGYFFCIIMENFPYSKIHYILTVKRNLGFMKIYHALASSF